MASTHSEHDRDQRPSTGRSPARVEGAARRRSDAQDADHGPGLGGEVLRQVARLLRFWGRRDG